MSQENVEVVRSMWNAFLGADPMSGLSFCDPEIEWDGRNLPDGKVAKGREALVDHALRWAEMWEDWRMEPQRFIDAGGEHVVLIFRETGRSESGARMDERHAELYRVRDGKVVHRKGFSDPAEALEAVGLSEQDAPAGS
jgi:ketosteroid isomerase-like protein